VQRFGPILILRLVYEVCFCVRRSAAVDISEFMANQAKQSQGDGEENARNDED